LTFHVKPEDPSPSTVAALFGTEAAVAHRYADWLADAGVERGLLGPHEVPRLWERHLLNCAVVAPHLPCGAVVADVGTGAGLPGIVWAIARPDLRVVLIEPLLRRVQFLREVVTDLGLEGTVEIRRCRAEACAGLGADVVTSRAVASLDRLVPWSAPLLRDGGQLALLKGQRAQDELDEAEQVLRRHGARQWAVRNLGAEFVTPPTTVVWVQFGQVRVPAGSRTTAQRRGRAQRRR
jgi:16S rRNA (guanine(527)-N(7))-methyltransferase RsmG